MFSRWSQENYFKYAIQSFGIDCLISNAKNSIPDTYKIQNPDYVSIHQEHKSISGKLAKQKQKLAEKVMEIEENDMDVQDRKMKKYLHQKSELLQSVEAYQSELEAIKLKKKETPKRLDIKQVSPEKEILTVINDQKHLLDTIKMIGFWAETALVNQIKLMMKNPDEARTLIRSIYQSNADLQVDNQSNRLYVKLHHSNFASVDHIIRNLFNVLNKTQTVFPGTDLTIFYVLVSDKFHE
jgi:vacuolar-type H+-ATPase subunit I/STV1